MLTGTNIETKFSSYTLEQLQFMYARILATEEDSSLQDEAKNYMAANTSRGYENLNERFIEAFANLKESMREEIQRRMELQGAIDSFFA